MSKGHAKSRRFAVLGFRAVGKSSLTIQFVDNYFVESYSPTIENTFHKDVRYSGTEYSIEVVDTAGQDEFSILPQQYAVGIHGYLMVYSVTSRSSYEKIKVINDKLLAALGSSNVPRVLVGNQTDLMDRVIPKEEAQQLAHEWGCGFSECSAKLNEHVDDVFMMLLSEVEKQMGHQEPPREKTCAIL
eukprot:Rmarinus@m.23406